MKIAFISDIHGNSSALEAVFSDIKKLNINKIYCLGDFVGYYYEPDRCVDLLIKHNVECILGNHEKMFLDLLQKPKLIDQMTKKYGNGIKYAVDKLGQNHINFIKNLRENKSFVIDDIKVLMAHGTPWDTNYYVYPNSKEKIFQRLANYNENYIFLGHTHIQMIKELNSTIIVNPGSVGQPRDAGNEAKWFILDTISKEAKFIKTPYDVRNIIKQIKTYDPNKLSLIKYFEN